MSINDESDNLFMMPVHFGPTCGPRQTPDGGRYINHPPQKQRKITVRFLTDAAQLGRLLPPGFVLLGEPVVSVEMGELRDIAWLAGRGYNTLGVGFPASYGGEFGITHGIFLSVLWENLADPIITGREQLGYNKIFAEIDNITEAGGKLHTAASWDGFEFARMAVSSESLTEIDPSVLAKNLPGEGILHYKYVPRTGGTWQGVDAEYATISAWNWDEQKTLESQPAPPRVRTGIGDVQFNHATWEQLPTQFRIVNALAALPVVQSLGAVVTESESACDFRYQRIL